MPKPDFTSDDLLESILRESRDNMGPDDALTMEELYQKLEGRVGRDRLRRKMHELKRDGKLECVKVRRLNLSDEIQTIRAYRFKKRGDDEVA